MKIFDDFHVSRSECAVARKNSRLSNFALRVAQTPARLIAIHRAQPPVQKNIGALAKVSGNATALRLSSNTTARINRSVPAVGRQEKVPINRSTGSFETGSRSFVESTFSYRRSV